MANKLIVKTKRMKIQSQILLSLNYNRQLIVMMVYKQKNTISLLIFTFTLIALTFCSTSPDDVFQSTQSHKQYLPSNPSDKQRTQPTNICDGNRLQFNSPLVLYQQDDLTQTFQIIQKQVQVKNISYSDRLARQYTIYRFKPHLVYLQSKQVAEVSKLNVLNISGGYIRINYTFQWQKEQLGSTINGTGYGVVSTDPITFQKTLFTNNTSHQLEWKLLELKPITITNSLTLSIFSPYKDADFQIINQMLNQIKNNDTTVKIQLVKALNLNFKKTLEDIVKKDNVTHIPQEIQYSYNDYRGPFSVIFANVLRRNFLTKDGLTLILSQSIKNDSDFQCGAKVPQDHQNITKYGGTQEYISNIFFNSTLIYALKKHSLDVFLSQEFWQSRAFQFFIGDLHDVIPSTRNISSFKELNGKCQTKTEQTFGIVKKTISSYSVKVNFTCYLQLNTTKLIDIDLPVEYEIAPILTGKELNFVIRNIDSIPSFIQNTKYKINNHELASFMLLQTLKTAGKSKVIGSGFKVKSRKYPQLQVRDQYLFLYDKSKINDAALQI